jgi:hypothetical protein
MSYGMVEQIDRKMLHRWETHERKTRPWYVLRKHNNFSKYLKKAKHKVERMRPIEEMPMYNRYGGYEY